MLFYFHRNETSMQHNYKKQFRYLQYESMYVTYEL